jgi:hypothetical protein
MEPTRRFAALVLVSTLLLGGCTGSEGPNDDGGATGSTETGPTPAQSLTPGVARYTYENAGLTVRVDLEGDSGTMAVDNATGNDLDRPDLYVLDAVDGHEIDVQVLDSEPVGAGDSATFDVSMGEADIDRIGLLVLLFGKDNYGAFVRTG